MSHKKDFIYNIGEEVNELVIVDKEYRVDKNNIKRKWYKYKCKKCPNEDWILEDSLKKGTGCNVCSGRKALKGYNDIATTDPWMCKYIVNEEDWHKYKSSSNKLILMRCPFCKDERLYQICRLNFYKKLPCCCESGGFFPEKFICNLLKQIKIDYISQLSKNNFNWIENKKRYDFYFELNNEKYIVEVHGNQHYEDKPNFNTSLKEQQNNDIYKYNLAIQNGIRPENYIVLDCRKSELEWIKNSVLNSRLNEVFDLNDIDWQECEEYALGNLVKEVCDYWHEHYEIKGEELSTRLLGEIFGISKGTTRDYLKKGTLVGWCNYNSKEAKNRAIKRKGKNGTRVKVLNEKGEVIYKFCSMQELNKNSKECLGVYLSMRRIMKIKRTGEMFNNLYFIFE